MVCVDLDHPEIVDFIEWKKLEERKAKKLILAGYSSDLDGEAYKTVSGQNANNSVRVPDQFMKALDQNKIWSLRERNSKKVISKILAKDLWQKFANQPGSAQTQACNLMIRLMKCIPVQRLIKLNQVTHALSICF